MATKLQNKVQYEAKVAELRGLVEAEARKLQDVTEAKDSSLREIRELAERKALLLGQLKGLSQKIVDAQEVFEATIKAKTAFIENAKKELKKEKEALKDANNRLKKTTEEIEALMPVFKELKEFITKEAEARKDWLKMKGMLHSSIKDRDDAVAEAKKEKAEALKEKLEADAFKIYITALYGKLASYVSVAKETIEYVNKELEKSGMPLQFEKPKIKLIKFEDFNKEL